MDTPRQQTPPSRRAIGHSRRFVMWGIGGIVGGLIGSVGGRELGEWAAARWDVPVSVPTWDIAVPVWSVWLVIGALLGATLGGVLGRVIRGRSALVAGVVSWGGAGAILGIMVWLTGLTFWGPREVVFGDAVRIGFDEALIRPGNWVVWLVLWAGVGGILGVVGAVAMTLVSKLFRRKAAPRQG